MLVGTCFGRSSRPLLNWQKTISINLTGALNMHHAVSRHGRATSRQYRQHLLGCGAGGFFRRSGLRGVQGGLIGFSKTIAREHARHNINVNVVCPGIVNTKLYADYKKGARNPDKLDDAFRRAIPFGRLGEPADLPGAICFLASDDAAYITGQVISGAVSQWPAN